MPIFMVERQFAEALETPEDGYAGLNRINAEEEVRWLMSFLSADRRKTYCLYEAESAEAILRAARHAGIPSDVITEIPARLMPDGSLAPVV